MIREEWRDVIGYEGIYKISNHGKVIRIGKRYGGHIPPTPDTPLACSKGRYAKVTLTGKGFPRTNRVVHRLMWEAFRFPVPKGLEINHKNGNGHDNRLENLEIVSHSENVKHGYHVLGHIQNRPRGSNHYRTKLTDDDVREIRRLASLGMKQREIAKKYRTKQANISHIVLRRQWRHVE